MFDYAKFIRDERKKRGINQEEMGYLLGVYSKQVSNMETGKSNPTWNTFMNALDALGYDIRLVPKDKECSTCRNKEAHDSITKNGNVPMCCVHCQLAEDLRDKWKASK